MTVLYDYFPYGIELFWGKTLIPRQYNGLHPEFAYHPFSLNMHMHLLVAIEAVKEKPVWPWNILDCRHIDAYLNYRRITWQLSMFVL